MNIVKSPHHQSSHALRSLRTRARSHTWRRDVVELAGVFVAVAAGDAVANVVVHGHDGPVLLGGSALVLLATAALHSWWAHRREHAPPGAADAAPAEAAESVEAAAPAENGKLWRIRTTVVDAPGSLASVCRALAGLPVNIVHLQTHPLAEATVDEFLVQAPEAVPAQEIRAAIRRSGGAEVWIEAADAHDLVDVPTRILGLATRTALDAAELPLALRQLFGHCRIRSTPDGGGGDHELDGTTMRLRDRSGGTITVTRDELPFTPTEFARARALLDLDAVLGPRVPDARHVLRLPDAGEQITIRRADLPDRDAARELHARCSAGTLRNRYHGPVRDADRYLDHLLDPRFGQTLAVEAGSRMVALGHLLWDDDGVELAVLVEDAWQRRGLGQELVRRLSALAADAGFGEVYAITQSSNSAMIATMRGLDVPLDYQVEDGTLVITAHIADREPASRAALAGGREEVRG